MTRAPASVGKLAGGPGAGTGGADASGDSRAHASSPSLPVYSFVAGVTGCAAIGTWLLRDVDAPPFDARMSMLAIALGLALAERFPVNLEIRREQHSFSLSTIPLVVGLFTLDPLSLVLVRLASGAVVLVVPRRQAALKLVANLTSFWIEVVVAVMVFHLLVPTGELSVGAWMAAFAAAIAGGLTQVLVISVAVAIFLGRFDASNAGPLVVVALGAVADTCLALVAVTLLVEAPAALALLGIVPVLLWISYTAYTRLHHEHRRLDNLYRFTRALDVADTEEAVATILLDQCRELLRADRCWLFVSVDGGGRCWSAGAGAGPEVEDLGWGCAEASLHRLVGERPTELLDASRAESDAAARVIRSLGHRQALVATLVGATGMLATLTVADRHGDLRDFNREDLDLFDTLARQAGAALDNAELIDRLRAEAAANEYLSLHDTLTDLPNRVHFDRALARTLAGRRRVGVLLLDLDGFKEVNDTLGHHNGDMLLQVVGARLRAVIGNDGVVARLGGDEFAVLLDDVEVDRAVEAAHDMCKVLEQPVQLGDLEVSVGASVGIAVAPDHGRTAELVLQRADVAMYQAKGSDSSAAVYDAAEDDYSPARLALVGELRTAVHSGQVDVHFQPLVRLDTESVIGVEALARWTHPRRGPVPPDEFIRLAENTGLMNTLTDRVLTEALARCAEWRAAGHDLRVSVNLSARNLLDPWLIDLVRARLRDTQLPGSALCLEITESSAMAEPARSLSLLTQLGDLGVSIAIDDFGTGYSSLAYLQHLPVHEVKIDRSFVTWLGTPAGTDADLAVVEAVAELCSKLGLVVVAEGVEHAATVAVLRDAGCRVAQGYRWAPPLPAEGLLAWLADLADRDRCPVGRGLAASAAL